MIYRVAQVVYTASSIDPNAKIYLSIEGELLDENYPLGGEGIVLTEPVTRQQLVEDFSIS
jgi:spore germination protein GerM